jgi:hypothetical protein
MLELTIQRSRASAGGSENAAVWEAHPTFDIWRTAFPGRLQVRSVDNCLRDRVPSVLVSGFGDRSRAACRGRTTGNPARIRNGPAAVTECSRATHLLCHCQVGLHGRLMRRLVSPARKSEDLPKLPSAMLSRDEHVTLSSVFARKYAQRISESSSKLPPVKSAGRLHLELPNRRSTQSFTRSS